LVNKWEAKIAQTSLYFRKEKLSDIQCQYKIMEMAKKSWCLQFKKKTLKFYY